MIDTIANTAVASATTIIAKRRRNTDSKVNINSKKGGAWRLPPFCCFTESTRKRAKSTYVSRATRTAKAVWLAVVQL